MSKPGAAASRAAGGAWAGARTHIRSMPRTTTPSIRCFMPGLSRSSGRTRRRVPAAGIVLLLEMRAGPKWLREVSGVHDLGFDDEQGIAVRHIEAIEILGHRGVGAV